MPEIVWLPLADVNDQIAYGSIGTQIYFDRIDGTPYTAHQIGSTYWIVRHVDATGYGRGKPVARSQKFRDRLEFRRAWDMVRSTE